MGYASACRYAQHRNVPLEVLLPADPPCSQKELTLCERAYSIVTCWLWLSYRFGDAFPERETIQVCFLAVMCCGWASKLPWIRRWINVQSVRVSVPESVHVRMLDHL